MVLIVAKALLNMSAMATTLPVTCKIEFDRAVLPAETAQRAVMKISLVTPEVPAQRERPPVNLAVVLDRSGSMGGDKIVKAREAAIEALRRLGPTDIFSLIAFDHDVETIVPAQAASNTAWIEERIRAIQPRGSTAIFAGVSQGAAELRRNIESRRYVSRIILLSDGQANVGPSTPQELGRLGASLVKEGISVTSVGVGIDYNEDLMTRISQQSDGNAYFVANSGDLPRIFQVELGSVLTVVAQQVILNISCTDGVRPVRVIGREGRISGNGVEFTLNQLYGGQEKFALVEVELPPAKPDELRDIATATCSFTDAITTRKGQVGASGALRFSGDRQTVEESVNKSVQRELGLSLAGEAMVDAVNLSDSGDRRGASDKLREESSRLRALSGRYNMPELERQAADLEGQADSIAEQPLAPATRKMMITESFQQRNQQNFK